MNTHTHFSVLHRQHFELFRFSPIKFLVSLCVLSLSVCLSHRYHREHLLEFTRDRKSMSVVSKDVATGKTYLFCKVREAHNHRNQRDTHTHMPFH